MVLFNCGKKDIILEPDSVKVGEWRNQPGLCRFYILGDDVVVVDENKGFVTVLKGGAGNARVEHARDID